MGCDTNAIQREEPCVPVIAPWLVSLLTERLALPPFLEPRRTEIEANLTPISV